jgi:hypothetical protein
MDKSTFNSLHWPKSTDCGACISTLELNANPIFNITSSITVWPVISWLEIYNNYWSGSLGIQFWPSASKSLTQLTACCWWSYIAIRTSTNWIVPDNSAVCCGSTRIFVSTGIYTLSVFACSIVRAFVIGRATHVQARLSWWGHWKRTTCCHASLKNPSYKNTWKFHDDFLTWSACSERVSLKSMDARTLSSVIRAGANCVCSTFCGSTCINTISQLADVWVRTVFIYRALRPYLN